MNVHAILDRLMMDAGAYSPMELLLSSGLLLYDDYLAWRRGDLRDLDAVLIDGAGAGRALRAAGTHAAGLGLAPRRVVYEGWGDHAGKRLAVSSAPGLDELLHTHYCRAAGEGRQLDIFLDSAPTVAVNTLVEALRARRPGNARCALARLADVDHDRNRFASAEALIGALELPAPAGHAQGLERLDELMQAWSPAASTLLAGSAQDFLRPLWRDIACSLDASRFDPRHPERHASWAYRNGLDWENVKRSVCAVRGYARVPVLVRRLAEAEWSLHDRLAAVRHWFEICRVAPSYFADLIEERDFPDLPLRKGWQSAQEQDFGPEISGEWFPAWMLLREPGLARALAPSGEADGPGRAFDLARALLKSDAQDVTLRRELRQIHPALFASFMADARRAEKEPAPRLVSTPLWPDS